MNQTTAPAAATDTLSDQVAALPVYLQLELIDAEVWRLTRIIRRWPTGRFADRCRIDRDRQLERRHVLQQLRET